MKYRDLVRALRRAGFTSRPGKGDHEVWTGPNGARAVLVVDVECSPAVTRGALQAIKQAEEGDEG
ncbi:MAG: type II toxin-antitoxin system HicA family toxin [Propionibacteriaceae bacterium]|jgi:predicted RNA binding protein YcfA (HicA-like mRNA interferase family)|nr:type II toxin-antitoxin system HicA family toxin [Propionibacteriaceae bacterium]